MKNNNLFFIPFYRIIFKQNKKIYEIYVRCINDDSIVGFIEAEEIIFSNDTNIIESTIKDEFQDTDIIYIPLHTIQRIEEINIRNIDEDDVTDKVENILYLPYIC